MDINCKKKIQSVKLNLQNGQVEIILRALELYKYNLNYMLDTEQCSDTERQEKLAMVQFTFEQVLSIQAEQVNGKSVDTETTTSQFSKAMPENNLLEEENHYIVIEMSNFQLLDIEKFKPEISTVINLTPDHLDYMASLDEYYASKMRIYENCESDDEIFVNNIDDETLQEYLKRYPVYCGCLTQSLNKPADCRIIDEAIYFRGEHIIDLKDIKIVGDHNVQNIMIAATICMVAGVDSRIIRKVISNFKGVEHRIEFVREYNGVKVYNDSKATNTDASIIALKAFKQPVILLMGGFDKGLDLKEMSTYNSHIKKLVTFGAAGQRFKEDMHHEDSYYEDTLKDAVNKAFEISEPGDIILLSPSTSSFDEFKGYEERGRIFKQYVNEK